MTIIGSGAAMSATKSQPPLVQTLSMISSHTAVTVSRGRAHGGGEASAHEPAATHVVGASMSIIIGRAPESGRAPAAFEKRRCPSRPP